MLRLFHIPLSPFCRKVRLTLGEKRIEVELVEERYWEASTDFLRRNPAGKVPVLRLEGRMLAESQAICEYIDELHPSPPLMPKDAAARSQMEMLGAALDAYRLDNGRYPTTAQGLQALREEPTLEPRPRNWNGPYLRRAVPLDPWDNPYVYIAPGEANPGSYDLVSYGADGLPGGEGENADIRSWD